MQSPRLLKTLSPLFLIPLLSACATAQPTVEVCRTKVDWQRLGYQDALHGKNRKNFGRAFSNCKVKSVTNEAHYSVGWQKGVKLYCSPRNGFKLGTQGLFYNNICPDTQISAFNHAWRRGLRRYCVPSTAYKLALTGQAFPGYCAPDLNVAFKKSYNQGRYVRRNLEKLKGKYRKLKGQVKGIQTEIQTKEKRLEVQAKEFSSQPFSPRKQYLIQKKKIRLEQLITCVRKIETRHLQSL